MKTIRITYRLEGTIDIDDNVTISEGDNFRDDEVFCAVTGAQCSDVNVLSCADIEVVDIDEAIGEQDGHS